MIEDHAAKGVVNSVVEVIAELAAANGFADDLGHGGGGGSDEKSPRFGENFDRAGKKSVQFGVDRSRQALEGRNGIVIVCWKAAADIKQLEIEAARLRF